MNTDKLTTVLTLGDHSREIVYILPAREAVIAAHAQSRGDYNTWNYETTYGAAVLETALGFSLGDFWAAKPLPVLFTREKVRRP